MLVVVVGALRCPSSIRRERSIPSIRQRASLQLGRSLRPEPRRAQNSRCFRELRYVRPRSAALGLERNLRLGAFRRAHEPTAFRRWWAGRPVSLETSGTGSCSVACSVMNKAWYCSDRRVNSGQFGRASSRDRWSRRGRARPDGSFPPLYASRWYAIGTGIADVRVCDILGGRSRPGWLGKLQYRLGRDWLA
jgi:hypothetical protein